MNSKFETSRKWLERILMAVFFVGMGLLIFSVFSPLRPMLNPVQDYLGRIGLILVLTVLWFLIRRNPVLGKFKDIILALDIMIITVSLDWVFSNFFLDTFKFNGNSEVGFALQKLNECMIVVASILVFSKLSGNSFGTLYIQKGNLKLGLIIGGGTLLLAAAGSIPMAALFNIQPFTIQQLLSWAPWILLFVVANATQEELLFRGLFLQKLDPLYGKFLSSFLIAFVFSFLHIGVTYTADQRIFLLVTFGLALLWGYIMQKTKGIWGSILFHAGMDIPVILGIFSNIH
jgi:uncharacterized protein